MHGQVTKSYDIDSRLVLEAYKRVESNGGSAGEDGVSLAKFEEYRKKAFRAYLWLGDIAARDKNLFCHWRYGVVPTQSINCKS